MWVRRTSEKVSLLTVGNVTYSSDPRIRVKFQYPNIWRLMINPTQWDDAGIYMCQVSTHPPRLFTTNLRVIEPPLRLTDEDERDIGDRYYKTGSIINLRCQVSRSFLYKEQKNILKSLETLYTHNNTTISSTYTISGNSSSDFLGTKQKNSRNSSILSLGNSKNNNKKITAKKNVVSFATDTDKHLSVPEMTTSGVNTLSNDLLQSFNQTTIFVNKLAIDLEQQFNNLVFCSKDDKVLPSMVVKRASLNDKWFTRRVTIRDAKLTDSGNYSCSIGKMFIVIVKVQVLTGELPAAVHHNSDAAIVIYNECIKELMHLYWIYVIAAYFI